jgi:hypothetical protein
MSLNFPGPWQLDILYQYSGVDHHMKLNIDVSDGGDVGADFSTIVVKTKGGGTNYLDLATDDFIALIAPYFEDAVQFVTADLYFCVPDSFERIWHSAYGIGVAGDSASPTSPASEAILTFRSEEGGILKITMEEVWVTVFGKTNLSAGTGITAALRDYILGDDSIVLARDTSYAVAPLHLLYGQNERIFRLRYR